jgi:hypothetical protein
MKRGTTTLEKKNPEKSSKHRQGEEAVNDKIERPNF